MSYNKKTKAELAKRKIYGQQRRVTFTINNYTQDDIDDVMSWEEKATKLTGAYEKSKDGVPHIQGAISWKDKKSLKQLKELNHRAHWEKMVAVKDGAFAYCRKGEGTADNPINPDVFVDKLGHVGQGKRTDLDDVIEDIKDGMDMQDIWENHPNVMIKYSKGVELYNEKIHPVVEKSKYSLKDFKWPELSLDKPTILWGDAGIGKTEFALAHFKNALMVRHMDDLGKLTTRHDGIVFDDMSFMHMPRESHLHLLDERTSSIHIRYKTATIPGDMKRIFTTNIEGGEIVKLDDKAVKRRVKVIHLHEGPFKKRRKLSDDTETKKTELKAKSKNWRERDDGDDVTFNWSEINKNLDDYRQSKTRPGDSDMKDTSEEEDEIIWDKPETSIKIKDHLQPPQAMDREEEDDTITYKPYIGKTFESTWGYKKKD